MLKTSRIWQRTLHSQIQENKETTDIRGVNCINICTLCKLKLWQECIYQETNKLVHTHSMQHMAGTQGEEKMLESAWVRRDCYGLCTCLPWGETRVDVISNFPLACPFCVPFALRQHSSTFFTDPVSVFNGSSTIQTSCFFLCSFWDLRLFRESLHFIWAVKRIAIKSVTILSYCCFRSRGSGMMVSFSLLVLVMLFSLCVLVSAVRGIAVP